MSEHSPIPFDYHSHNRRCGHAVGEIGDYIEAARNQWMTSFGVSDHIPSYFLPGDQPLPKVSMAHTALPDYLAEAERLKREYRGTVDVLVGIEADFVEGVEAELRALLDSQPLDYVLGSVHFALGAPIFRRDWHQVADPEAIFAEYYRLVALAARSGLFDILSHLTAVEAYSPPLSDDLAAQLYPPVADAVAESGCAVEINTSGYRKRRAADGGPGDEPFPDRRMLRLLVERNIPLTYGSDCHAPGEVGYGATKVASLLRELGLDPDRTVRRPLPRSVKRGESAYFNTFATE